jgi:hypothetical protein
VLVEYVPAPQSVHAALPLVVLYFPATQAVHGPPSGPVKPALHGIVTQAVTDELPVGEVLPAGQFVQTVALTPPVTLEYVPAKQLVQIVAPVLEYFPAEQDKHIRVELY